MTKEPLIEVKELEKYFSISKEKKLHAVDGVSFQVYPGETLGLVGESGCGKSTIGNVIMKLLPKTGGDVLFRGKSIYQASAEEKKTFCRKMQIIFQDPYSSLNPRKTIYSILKEAYAIHRQEYTEEKIKNSMEELYDMVEFPRSMLGHYPHELDGGMRQVVGIARALSLSPEFIVCDEPVSSLDVSVQARIVNLLIDVQKRKNLSYLFISHDLSVVRHLSDKIAVMYLGQIVEMANTDELFSNAMHPYTLALLSAIPRISSAHKVKRIVLKGDVPSPVNPKPGCRFGPRCWMEKRGQCNNGQMPELMEVEPGHLVACPFAKESRSCAATLIK